MIIGLKIALAALFFLCLLDMPYGYYQLVRFVALAGFAILAYKANEKGQKTEAIGSAFTQAVVFEARLPGACCTKITKFPRRIRRKAWH